MTSDSKDPRPRFATGLALGAILSLSAAAAGAVVWSLGLQWIDLGEPRAMQELRRRVDVQEQRIARAEARSDASAAMPPASAIPAAGAREVALERELQQSSERARTLERERETERTRQAEALDEVKSDAAALREELARAKAERESLTRELAQESVARAALESERGALLERTIASELRERERDALRREATGNAPAHPEVHSASSSWIAELAQKLPADLLGPSPSVAAPGSSTLSVKDANPAAAETAAEVEVLRRAETESARLAQKQGELEDLRAQTNRLLELDGYGEMQFVRIGAVEEGVLRDVAIRVVGAHGENRRFVAAGEMRFEAFPGLRSLRTHLVDGYEQIGGAAAIPFENGAIEITWADVRIGDWRALLQARGLWSETGSLRTGVVDARFPAAETLAALNDLFGRAKGTRKFVLRRLDQVYEGAQLHGIELHQNEVGGAGLKVIFEAETAELWWDPAQKSAELVLEHGFQRRGTQRVPFFEQRARVYLSYDEAPAWDEARVPFHLAARTSR